MCAVAVLCRHGLPTEVERWDRGGLAGALVDLHTSIVGATADPATVWSVLSAGAETLELAGSRVLGTGSEANALIVAVHAAAHGSDGFERPCEDLTRALARCELETWQAAHRRAIAIGAEPAFAAGLAWFPPRNTWPTHFPCRGRRLRAWFCGWLTLPRARFSSRVCLELAGGHGYEWWPGRSRLDASTFATGRG
jgi:hypothetical protein